MAAKMSGKSKLEMRKFVRYKEGAEMYGMSQRAFYDLVNNAKAKYKVGKMVLVNCSLLDAYLETFRVDE